MKIPVFQDEHGYNYVAVYREDLSNPFYYTHKLVYHIFTSNPKWAASILPSVLNDNSITAGEHAMAKNWIESLRPYHTVKYIEGRNDKYDDPVGDNDGYYEYTIIKPYDD